MGAAHHPRPRRRSEGALEHRGPGQHLPRCPALAVGRGAHGHGGHRERRRRSDAPGHRDCDGGPGQADDQGGACDVPEEPHCPAGFARPRLGLGDVPPSGPAPAARGGSLAMPLGAFGQWALQLGSAHPGPPFAVGQPVRLLIIYLQVSAGAQARGAVRLHPYPGAHRTGPLTSPGPPRSPAPSPTGSPLPGLTAAGSRAPRRPAARGCPPGRAPPPPPPPIRRGRSGRPCAACGAARPRPRRTPRRSPGGGSATG